VLDLTLNPLLFSYAQLGKMRYATVNEFHGRKMVNIREYYEADGEIRPGRKGLCLRLMLAVLLMHLFL